MVVSFTDNSVDWMKHLKMYVEVMLEQFTILMHLIKVNKSKGKGKKGEGQIGKEEEVKA